MVSKYDISYLKAMESDLIHIIRSCKYLNNKYLKKDIERKADALYDYISRAIKKEDE